MIDWFFNHDVEYPLAHIIWVESDLMEYESSEYEDQNNALLVVLALATVKLLSVQGVVRLVMLAALIPLEA